MDQGSSTETVESTDSNAVTDSEADTDSNVGTVDTESSETKEITDTTASKPYRPSKKKIEEEECEEEEDKDRPIIDPNDSGSWIPFPSEISLVITPETSTVSLTEEEDDIKKKKKKKKAREKEEKVEEEVSVKEKSESFGTSCDDEADYPNFVTDDVSLDSSVVELVDDINAELRVSKPRYAYRKKRRASLMRLIKNKVYEIPIVEDEPDKEGMADCLKIYPRIIRKTFSKDQVLEFKTEYNEYRDHESGIGIERALILARSCGLNPSDALFQECFDELDENETGVLNEMRFLVLLAKIARRQLYEEDRLFDAIVLLLDPYRTGILNTMELKHLLTTEGERLDLPEITAFLKLADKGKKGKFRYKSFIKRCNEAREIDVFQRRRQIKIIKKRKVTRFVKKSSAVSEQPTEAIAVN